MSELWAFLGQSVIVAGTVALLVMGLALFFRWLPRLGPQEPKVKVQTLTELFDEGVAYDVLLSSGQRLSGLRFEGLVRTGAEAGWTLSQMAIMRRADGGKVLVRLDTVRVFEQVARP